MIKKLSFRFTVIFSVLTSLVLFAAVSLSFAMAKESYLQGCQVAFENSVSVITEKLEKGEIISDKWLGERETAAMSLIFVFDNGTPLHFKGAWKPQTAREQLCNTALSAATENGINFDSKYATKKTAHFTVQGSAKEKYRSAAVYIPVLNNNRQQYIGVAVLQDDTAVNNQINRMLLMFCALWIFGTIALCAISRFLCKIALKPTETALKQQADFTAAASHELRSPLAVISASLQAAQANISSPEKANRFIDAARTETLRLSHLTEDLLVLANGDANALSVHKKPIAPDTFCIELYEKYRLLAKEKQHELKIMLPDENLPEILADAERLTQLFGILISNAIDYTPKNTSIDLALQHREKQIVISVQDYGNGILKSERSKIFDRFYRGDKSRTDKAHFGLGLSIAKEIAELHNAKLYLCEVGKGCRFEFCICAETE